MKFQVKTLIAALALTVSGVASAANVATGNSSLYLSVFDKTNNVAVFLDTGFTYSTLNEIGTDVADSGFNTANTAISFNAAQNSAYTSFLSTADTSNIFYNVFAGDNLQDLNNPVGSRGFIASISTTAATNFNISRQPLVTLMGNYENMMAGVQGFKPNSYFSGNKMNNVGPIAAAAVGQDMTLYQIVEGSGSGAGTKFFYDKTNVSFSNAGVLTISAITAVTPVPEADSYAMMGLGLAVIGAIARRRKAAK